MAKSKKIKNVFGLSSNHMLVLCIVLLFIVIEAIFILQGQNKSVQATKSLPSVAGTSTGK